jgi:hypothetical protein
MKCNCINEIETEVAKRDYQGKKIKSVKFLSAVLIFGIGKAEKITTSELEAEVEGMKKKPTINMVHTYCPFCGTKIKDDDNR